MAEADSSGRPTESFQRHEKLPALGAKRLESMVAVEVGGCVVLGINNQGKDGHFRTCGPVSCIREQGASELLAVERLVNRKPSNTRHGNGWIARQLLR